MRPLLLLGLFSAACLGACSSHSDVPPAGIVLTWLAGSTTGNQYQTLHLTTGSSATIFATQDATRAPFTAFLSGDPPNLNTSVGEPAASDACAAFSLDSNATTALAEHTLTALTTGTCYLVVTSATTLAYTQLTISDP